MASDNKNIINQAYNAFNARDIDKALSLMDKNVHWPNGWEGGFVEGHDEVREYWTRQWKEIDPVVKPVSINENSNAELVVDVHQVAKDLRGNILFDGMVTHVYKISEGLIKSMEILKS